MDEKESAVETLIDFITGRAVENTGAEENRQAVERYLVEEKGYPPADIEVDAPLALTIAGEPYSTKVDLVVKAAGRRVMAVKCAAGSLGSREREIVAAARLLEDYQLPFSVVSDGRTANVLQTVTGKKRGEGMDAIPSREEAEAYLAETGDAAYPDEKKEREKIIFRSYDSMNVNVQKGN